MLTTMRLAITSCSLLMCLFFGVNARGQTLTPQQAQKRIDDATPPLLPQKSPVKKVRSDAADGNLVGKVRSVSQSSELPDTGAKNQDRLETFYDKHGNLVKKVEYSFFGDPRSVTVYGYVDGKRVSNSASIFNEYDPPALYASPLPPDGGQKPKTIESKKYSRSYAYVYDDSKRLTECVVRLPDGKVETRKTSVYGKNNVIWIYFNNEGKILGTGEEIFDEKEIRSKRRIRSEAYMAKMCTSTISMKTSISMATGFGGRLPVWKENSGLFAPRWKCEPSRTTNC